MIKKVSSRSPLGLVGLLAVSLIFLSQPGTAAAHERWFVDNPDSYPVDFSLLLSWPVLLVMSAGLLITGLMVALDRNYRHWRRKLNPALENVLVGLDEKRLRRVYAYLPLLLALHTAVPLLVNGFGLRLFAPNLKMTPSLLSGLFGLAEVLIALALVYGLFTRYAALALIVLYFLGGLLSFFLSIPALLLPEHCYLVGIGLFLYVVGRGPFSADALLGLRFSPNPNFVHLAIPALRWTLGLSIVLLALTEKLLNPALAQAFLIQKIDFNLGSNFGITNASFVYLAGFVELTFGLLLISGALPRLVIFSLWIPFNLTLPYLGWIELAGHLPTYAIMLVLLIVGPGSHRVARKSAELLVQEADQLVEARSQLSNGLN